MRMKRKGFTLIELMIVIAIIGILAGMALPRFSKAREQAKMKTCWGNSKNIESALEMYKMEDPDADDSATDLSSIEDALSEYLSGKKFPECPTKGGNYKYSEDSGVYCDKHGNPHYKEDGTTSR